jgi:hemerythrin
MHEGNGHTAVAPVAPVLHKLVHHALSHFIAEESLMRQHDFPGLLKHCRQRQRLRAKIANFSRTTAREKADIPNLAVGLYARLAEKAARPRSSTVLFSTRGVY